MSSPSCLLAILAEPSDFAGLSAELADLGVRTCYAGEVSGLLSCHEEADGSNPSVILCDADRLDWIEALRELREAMPGTAVVFLTRLADERLWLRMLDAGAFDLLEKPYRSQDLRWVVTTALKRRHECHAAVTAA